LDSQLPSIANFGVFGLEPLEAVSHRALHLSFNGQHLVARHALLSFHVGLGLAAERVNLYLGAVEVIRVAGQIPSRAFLLLLRIAATPMRSAGRR